MTTRRSIFKTLLAAPVVAATGCKLGKTEFPARLPVGKPKKPVRERTFVVHHQNGLESIVTAERAKLSPVTHFPGMSHTEELRLAVSFTTGEELKGIYWADEILSIFAA